VHDRVIIQRLTGKATTPATISERAKLPQKSGSLSCAFMAAGITSRIPLSVISMTVIETVSAESASRVARPRLRPDASNGRIVSA